MIFAVLAIAFVIRLVGWQVYLQRNPTDVAAINVREIKFAVRGFKLSIFAAVVVGIVGFGQQVI